MEFLDDDAKPRILFQARANPSSASELPTEPQLSKPFLFITLSISSILFVLSIFFLQSEPIRSILLWVALSILLGPFAPISLTGGDVRVGQGRILEFANEEAPVEEDTKKRIPQKRSKPRRADDIDVSSVSIVGIIDRSAKEENKNTASESNGYGAPAVEEEEWIEEDIEILKKQLVKHPVGKPRRWEVIAEAFRGRHKVESVISMAKDLGEKKVNNGDSYAQFLKKRKPVDKRIDGMTDELGSSLGEKPGNGGGGEGGVADWSSGEDIGLLNALKVISKDVPMRWEKIAAAVPGKSKAACMKRVADLKKDFRSAKAANGVE